jgi:hypothetical protein
LDMLNDCACRFRDCGDYSRRYFSSSDHRI